MKYKIRHWRWCIADRLSYWACLLRGHKWYVSDTWHGVPGNRASELEQQIRMDCLTLALFTALDLDRFNHIERYLLELSQLAGSNWGHYPLPPK